MVLFFISLFIPFLTAFLIVRLLLNFQTAEGAHLLFEIFLAWGLGMGLFSILAFLWLLVFNSWNQGLLILELSILLMVILLTAFPGSGKIIQSKPSPPTEKGPPLLVISIYLFFAYALLMFIFLVYINPHGRWDAWYIWNVRARFLYRGTQHWFDAFSPLLAHTDYPPLIPLNIARFWFQMKQETIVVPALISMLFTFGPVGLLVSSFCILRDRIKGYLAGMILMGTPFFIFLGADQIADNPIAYYYLATLILFYLYDKIPEIGSGFLILAGIMAGLSGWTKNEGLLFIAAVPLARLFVPRQGLRKYGKTMVFFGMGLIPIAAVILIFKIYFAPPNDLWGSQGMAALLNKLADLHRYAQIGKAFGAAVYNFGLWPLVSLNLLLILYGFLAGFTWRKLAGDLSFSMALLSILMAGYFFVFVLTPHDLSWHLRTALNRLFLQLWPSLLFTYFMLIPALPPTFDKPASS